jgi:signal transduction histidine kinase
VVIASRARLSAYAIALGAILGVVDSGQSLVLGKSIGVNLPWPAVLASNVLYWAAFGALVPLVVFVASRFRLDSAPRYRNVVVHCVAGVLFPIAHAGLYIVLAVFAPPLQGDFRLKFVGTVRDYIAAEFIAYWAIVGGFYAVHYYRESQRRQLAAARLEATLTETRLDALRSQINPHFLFNTLNSISTLTLRGEHNGAVEMLSRLSDLLRVALDDSCPQEVSLSRELEFLERYMAIQRIRFADRLTVCQRIAPDTRDALVPSLILQPLAENAIRHGIDAHCGIGVVTIEAERENGSLRLRVSDSGPGFPIDGMPTAARLGVGLSNTLARLEQLYGSGQHMLFGRSESGGGTVTITIPFRTVDMANDCAVGAFEIR